MNAREKLPAVVVALFACAASGAAAGPHARQVVERIEALRSPSPAVAAAGAEALGFLRAYAAADALAGATRHASPDVRREAAMALGYCGARKHVAALLAALDDDDWTVRQAAWVALTNVTGQAMGFDGLAAPAARRAQAENWRAWWAKQPTGKPPPQLLAALGPIPVLPKTPAGGPKNLALRKAVALSSIYRGTGAVLTDGQRHGRFWQTKNVPFPQHCTIDLARAVTLGCVVVHQYDNAGMHMTDYAISASTDGERFEQVVRRKGRTAMRLVVAFKPIEARYVRITSYATGNRTYPTTFHEVEFYAKAPPAWRAPARPAGEADDYRIECALRGLGALGGQGAAEAVAAVMAAHQHRRAASASHKTLVQVGLRALGRLGGPRALEVLTGFLDNPQWARYAADALGDLGDRRAVAPLTAAYPRYARSLRGRAPRALPRDDHPGLDPRDRMYETPYAIAQALSRLDISTEADIEAVRAIAPLLLANMPSDFDAAMLYEPEAYQLVTSWLLERASLRAAALDAAFSAFGRARKARAIPEAKVLAALARRRAVDVPYAALWLPAFAREPADAPALIALLEHDNGWVRINAAKALMFMSHRPAAGPIARLLAASKGEAEHGYFGKFMYKTAKQGQAEYNDPPPRWREAMVRALGRLGGAAHAKLLIKLLNDETSVLEVRHAAAVALGELGAGEALAALKHAAAAHPFHSIRLEAREALWRRGLPAPPPLAVSRAVPLARAKPQAERRAKPQAVAGRVVFIKGDNSMPNDFQIDIWRQTYSTTDSGPTYRLGKNLYVLGPAAPDGAALRSGTSPRSTRKVTQLTHYTDGYVADCEVSWDGRRVLFARRGGTDDPWWHVCQIGADGRGLRQITRGPYHDVQPAYLPDGRIVFSSSRIGLRDEYHGYYATGLTVMNSDGSDIHCIGFNLGRDNEPAILPDGRIAFSRLELFYSRLKTEITIHAALPDGTRDVTLYGPEWRDFWRRQTRLSREGWWGEVAPRHRVLRLTQVQPFDARRLICATTGGATIVGPGRYRHTVLPRDRNMAVTSPFPLGSGKVLCAATVRHRKRKDVDLGLYVMDAATGKLTLLYNDPQTADFEARPLAARPRPPVLAEDPATRSAAYTGRLFCNSVRITQDPPVKQRGKLVRVVEGMPIISRHQTHIGGGEAWKNHTGTHARVLGTVPLAADGSFCVEVPADRLIHVQVLDSDRRVVGNQQIWMYARPGETRSCIGCHERPDATMLPTHRAQVQGPAPVKCLPTGGEFTYRAKFWNKGTLTDEGEERTRTVRAVSLIGRQ